MQPNTVSSPTPMSGSASGTFSTSPTSSTLNSAPARQGSVSAHARRMSEEFSNLNVSGGSVRRAGSVKEDPLEFLKSFDTVSRNEKRAKTYASPGEEGVESKNV